MGGPGSNSPPAEALVERLFRRISEVSSLPAVAVRILEVANDPTTGAEDLLEAVRFDAAMAARIMRTVNSSYYSMQNKVADLKSAIALLGFKEIRNLAVTAYVAELFQGSAGHGKYTRAGLWNHMVGVAIAAKLIAETCQKAPPRQAYLAGLLHDLGLVLMDQYLHEPFCEVVDSLTGDAAICQVEQELLGFHHAQLGAFVASRWNLPEQLLAAIRWHHEPDAYQGEHREMVYVVSLANSLSNLKHLSSLGTPCTLLPPPCTITGLGLKKPQVERIWEDLDDLLRTADIAALAETG